MTAVPPPAYETLDNEETTEERTQQPTTTTQTVQQPAVFTPYQQPAMVTPIYPPTVVQHPPKEYIPNDYLILSLVVMMMCAFVSITTLFFTVPAFICSIFARTSKLKGVQFYREAKKFGLAALILDIIAVLWLFGWGIFTLSYVLYLVYISDIFY